jgi:hypothetical protein
VVISHGDTAAVPVTVAIIPRARDAIPVQEVT